MLDIVGKTVGEFWGKWITKFRNPILISPQFPAVFMPFSLVKRENG
jgi:hypothetical protein